MQRYEFFVYIITNVYKTVLYTGVTNDLERRMYEHKAGIGSTFASKYNCTMLLYYETFNNINQAIAREKQIKTYKRAWKEDLINAENNTWEDLAIDWDFTAYKAE